VLIGVTGGWQGMRNGLAKVLVGVAVALGLGAEGVALRATAQEPSALRPTLSDLMALTQLRHFKLWYAERVGNWKLASYELDQMETTLGRIKQLYPTAAAIAQATLINDKMEPVLSDIRRAIEDKNNARFEAAYNHVTELCNQCHHAAGFGFIVVRVPTKSPYANQIFEPQP